MEWDEYGKVTSIDKYNDFIELFQNLKDIEKSINSFLSKSINDVSDSWDVDKDIVNIEQCIDQFEDLFEKM